MSKVMDVVSDDVRAHRAEETVAFFQIWSPSGI